MLIISHRVNKIKDLVNTSCELGVEIDIRSNKEKLYLHHDPYVVGEDLETWLEEYNHAALILNVKEEGLESKLIGLMKKYKIDNYFFLDQSFPFLIKTANAGESRCAVRISEYEHIETVMSLSGKVDWVWVDCFNHFPLTKNDATRLQIEGGFKLCFVSPELQGRDNLEGVKNYRGLIESIGIKGDAVCTKHPNLWQ